MTLMTRTYICDRCPRVAVVVDEDDTLLCGACFLKQTAKRLRALQKDEPKKHAA